MGKSYIISSGTEIFINERISELIESTGSFPEDILKIDVEQGKASIGIDIMQSLKKWATIRPYSGKGKLAVIFNAQLLTIEAQNSILKLLEEPELDTSIILVSQNHLLLLPTIISRCQVFFDPEVALISDTPLYKAFWDTDLAGKFAFVEKISQNKQDALLFLSYLIQFYRTELLKGHQKKQLDTIKLLLDAQKKVQMKVPVKNALVNLVIQLDF